MVEKRVGPSELQESGRKAERKRLLKWKCKGIVISYKKGRAQTEVRGKRPQKKYSKSLRWDRRDGAENGKPLCKRGQSAENSRGTATPPVGRRTSKATLSAAHRCAIFKIF